MNRKSREWLTRVGVIGTLSLGAIGCTGSARDLTGSIEDQCAAGQAKVGLPQDLIQGQSVRVDGIFLTANLGALELTDLTHREFASNSAMRVIPYYDGDWHLKGVIFPGGSAEVSARQGNRYNFAVDRLSDNQVQIKNRMIRVVVTADCETLRH